MPNSSRRTVPVAKKAISASFVPPKEPGRIEITIKGHTHTLDLKEAQNLFDELDNAILDFEDFRSNAGFGF